MVRMWNEETGTPYVGRWILATIFGLFVVYGVAAIFWGFGVAGSGVFGRGEQIRDINSAANRTQAQVQFHARYQGIQALDAQIAPAARELESFRQRNTGKGDNAIGTIANEDARLSAVVIGIQQRCIAARAEYDAAARGINTKDFRDADLPAVIDKTDQSTDCEVDAA